MRASQAMWMILVGLSILIGPGCGSSAAGDGDVEILESRLVTDFSTDLPDGADNAMVALRLVDIRPVPGGQGDIVVMLQRRQGKWTAEGHSAAADYNQKSNNPVEIHELKLADGRLAGSIGVTINPDSPRPNAKPEQRTPRKADTFTVHVEAKVHADKFLAYEQDPEPHMPPWRKDIPQYGGRLIEGSFKAVRDGQVVEGKLRGAISPSPTAATFGVRGNLVITPAKGGGADLTARLSPKRVATGTSAVAERIWPQVQDWGRFDGLRVTVDSPVRRDDATVEIGIREAGGKWGADGKFESSGNWETSGDWFTANGAALLLGRQESFLVPFDHFRGVSEDGFLDIRRINGLFVGVNNAMGIGTVELTVRKIELVRWSDEGFGQSPEDVVQLQVEPGVTVAINGSDEVPKGLFGYHDVGNAKPQSGRLDPVEYMQSLKPGFLRPLTHVGFGAKPISDEEIRNMQTVEKDPKRPDSMFFRRAEAADAVDNVIWCHTVDLWARPGWMDQSMDRVVDGVRAFYRRQAASAWVPGDIYNVRRRFEVWNEPFIWGRHINMGHQNPEGRKAWTDPTQHGYIPAKLGAQIYAEIFNAAVDGAESANKHVQLGGPCAPAFSADSYGNFFNYVKYFIDASAGQIDFLTEHHYGGLPEVYPASYFVASAYSDVVHGKRYPIYNTECGDLHAPQRRQAWYNLKEILLLIRQVPDIVHGRAIHALWSGYLRDTGVENAMLLLAELRGKRLAVGSSDAGIITVASRRSDGRVVLVALNDTRFARKVKPAEMKGYVFQTGRQLSVEGQTSLEPVGNADALQLAPGAAACWVFRPTDRAQPVQAAVRLVSSFCDAVNVQVKPGASVNSKVLFRDRAKLNGQAMLRIVARDIQPGEAVAVIGSKSYQLPFAAGGDGTSVIQDIAIDPAELAKNARIEFRVSDPSRFNGYTLYAAAVIAPEK